MLSPVTAAWRSGRGLDAERAVAPKVIAAQAGRSQPVVRQAQLDPVSAVSVNRAIADIDVGEGADRNAVAPFEFTVARVRFRPAF